MASRCTQCGLSIDPTKDAYITIHERKGPSRDFCSMICANEYYDDEES